MVDKRKSFLQNRTPTGTQNRDLEVESIARQMKVPSEHLAFGNKELERKSELELIEDKIKTLEGKKKYRLNEGMI